MGTRGKVSVLADCGNPQLHPLSPFRVKEMDEDDDDRSERTNTNDSSTPPNAVVELLPRISILVARRLLADGGGYASPCVVA